MSVQAEDELLTVDQSRWLRKDPRAGGIARVEGPGRDSGLLDVGQLILADRNDVGLAEQDVGGLVNRVRQALSDLALAGAPPCDP